MKSLLFQKAWDGVFSQEVSNSPKRDRDQSLYEVFAACARQLLNEAPVFPSVVDDQKALICILRLPKDEVIVAAKVAILNVRLWHSHKSRLTVFKKDWDR